jgi:hypothetical protein
MDYEKRKSIELFLKEKYRLCLKSFNRNEEKERQYFSILISHTKIYAQHFLYFLPDPHGQSSFLPMRGSWRTE